MITFENYDRKIEKINTALAAYGIASLEDAAKNCKDVYFFEEGIRRGGAGEGFLFDLSKAGFSGKYHLRAIENGFVKQASVESLLHKYGFDEEGVLSFVTSAED